MEYKYCILSDENGSCKRFFELNCSGKIIDIHSQGNDNERYWELFDDEIHIYSNKREKTIVFNYIGKDNFYLYYKGLRKYEKPLLLKITNTKKNLIETRTQIINHHDVESGILSVGDYTYGGLNIIDKKYGGKVIVGNYCSIAFGVNLILGNHRIDSATTYPFNELAFSFSDHPLGSSDHFNKGNIIIGNDVWIGCNAHIMGGVSIGDGAIIAANSVVTKSVDSYSITAGNPAIHKKYRITDEKSRNMMLDIAWWNWDEKKINENIRNITELKSEEFINIFSHHC